MNTKYIAVAICSISANAFAQGGVGVVGADTTAPSQPAVQTTTYVSQTSTAAVDTTVSDHSTVVGHMGIAYMGAQSVPLAGAAAGLTAPVVGVRYWQNEKMGFDLGLGLSMSGGSSSTEAGGTVTTTDQPGAYAVLLHAGVPFVLSAKKHYSFQVIPELNFGYAHQTIAAPAGQSSDNDVSNMGMRLDIGARAGAEIQFGFIGMPQLALQGSVGAFLSHNRVGSSTNNAAQNSSSTTFSTSVQNKPWDIFLGNVSAIYYF